MVPLVSVLIPCYNAERWVREAVESALHQTHPRIEVVVVDDGSTDSSLEVLRSFGGSIILETGPNRGGNPARNRLLELARGEWLQYLDADDYLLPDKVARQVEFLAAHPDTDVVYGPVTLEYWSEAETRRELLPIPEPHDPWVLLARWYLPQTGSPLWRRQAVLDVGGWKPDQPCCQEHELYLRLLIAGKRFTYCLHNGTVYRQWGEHTVCKRDKAEVRRRHMDVKQRAEDFLREGNELTPARLWAINQGRFEVARAAWQHHPAEALDIMRVVHRSLPTFLPGCNATPAGYRLLYRVLGFRPTETIADWSRPLRRGTGGPSRKMSAADLHGVRT